MSKSKNQHFLPRFYLKNWAHDKARNFVWAARRHKKKLEIIKNPKAIKSVCSKLHLYNRKTNSPDRTHQLDNFWDDLENKTAPIISKILNQKNLNSAEKRIFTKFIMSFSFRDPSVIQELRDKYPKRFEKLIENFSEKDRQLLAKDGYTVAQLISYIKLHEVELIENIGLDSINKIIDSVYSSRSRDRIESLHFSFRNIKKSSNSIVVSDRPLFMSGGLMSKNVLITLPLSDKCMYIASDNLKNITNCMALDEKSFVQKANKTITSQGNEWLISKEKNLLLEFKSVFGKAKKDFKVSD